MIIKKNRMIEWLMSGYSKNYLNRSDLKNKVLNNHLLILYQSKRFE